MSGLLKKAKKYDFVFIILAILIIIASIITPKSGELVLLDEAFDILIFLIVGTYISVKLISAGKNIEKKVKVIRALVISAIAVFSVFVTKDLVVDVVTGPKTIVLSSVRVSEYKNTSSSASRHYYLKGQDENGKNYRLEISKDDFYLYDNKNSITVKCYENTQRVVDII